MSNIRSMVADCGGCLLGKEGNSLLMQKGAGQRTRSYDEGSVQAWEGLNECFIGAEG